MRTPEELIKAIVAAHDLLLKSAEIVFLRQNVRN